MTSIRNPLPLLAGASKWGWDGSDCCAEVAVGEGHVLPSPGYPFLCKIQVSTSVHQSEHTFCWTSYDVSYINSLLVKESIHWSS